MVFVAFQVMLRQKSVDPNLAGTGGGETALHYAAWKDHPDCAKLLVGHQDQRTAVYAQKIGLHCHSRGANDFRGGLVTSSSQHIVRSPHNAGWSNAHVHLRITSYIHETVVNGPH